VGRSLILWVISLGPGLQVEIVTILILWSARVDASPARLRAAVRPWPR